MDKLVKKSTLKEIVKVTVKIIVKIRVDGRMGYLVASSSTATETFPSLELYNNLPNASRCCSPRERTLLQSLYALRPVLGCIGVCHRILYGCFCCSTWS